MSDAQFMHLALRLAWRGCGTTSPNPMVGAVLVKRRQNRRTRLAPARRELARAKITALHAVRGLGGLHDRRSNRITTAKNLA